MRVLVVHPDATAGERVADALGADGFAVETVRNGLEAVLALADADRPRMVVAWADTEEAVEMITAARGFAPPVRIVLVVPRLDDEAERRARRLGAAAVFRDPCELDDLRTAVINLAPRRPALGSGVYGRGE